MSDPLNNQLNAQIHAQVPSGQGRQAAETPTPLLEACDLVKRFPLRGTGGLLRRPRLQAAVDGVSLALYPGEVVAVVGESGSGKTTLGRMMLGLLAPTEGRVLHQGQDIAGLQGEAWRRFRRDVQVVFQDTGGSLNPRHSIGNSIALPLRYNRDMDAASAAAEVDRLLDAVGLPATHFRERLPSELSGGQRQRVGIARALASRPALIVADEPVSALDVSVRAQILRLMADLRARERLSYLFITHDLGVVRALADRVVVMLQGRVVESGTVDAVLSAPSHDYTRQLLAATPVPDPSRPLQG
jgi:ABC-type glutathione transport system ATPase component